MEERRKRLRKIVDRLPENIRYSETFAVLAATLARVVRENGLEGIVAKRAGIRYQRCLVMWTVLDLGYNGGGAGRLR